MKRASWLIGLALLLGTTARGTAEAPSVQISGTITTTTTIYEDAELVGDVTCEVVAAPCVAFGAPDITLKLNGFTITGRAEPPTGCVATADFFVNVEDGISMVGQSGVTVLGPGRVEKFGRYGVFAMSASEVTIKRVTSAENCFSGFQVWTVTDSDVMENVAARNAVGSEGFPCGGI